MQAADARNAQEAAVPKRLRKKLVIGGSRLGGVIYAKSFKEKLWMAVPTASLAAWQPR
jgi:hypothetical protein